MDELLAEAALKRGIITIRRPMNMSREMQQRSEAARRLVENGLAKWANPARTSARLTRYGWART